MENKTLKALLSIKQRLDSYRREGNNISKILSENKAEVTLLAEKFRLEKEEALLFAGFCIDLLDGGWSNSTSTISGLSDKLEISLLETLLYQNQIRSLVENSMLTEYHIKDSNSIVDLVNKEFTIHPSLRQHFN